MHNNKKSQNFDGLMSAWLQELNADALNKRFFNHLFDWFKLACGDSKQVGKNIQFPADLEEKREDWVIRLITRLLFVWFIKEKGFVAEELFKKNIFSLLKSDQNDSWYRAVLQNLFFSTLNTPKKSRRLSSQKYNADPNYTAYLYEDEIADGQEEKLLALFNKTPFLNGGLFDCLDQRAPENPEAQIKWVDCYTEQRCPENSLSVPDALFFDSDKGLLSIFERYKFTVEENTPVEQEVALDPELLGKVFENLLACYNPETREAANDTARKRTGSFYTPRRVVDFMVGEALLYSIAQKMPAHEHDPEFIQECIRYLLDYEDVCDDADDLFNEAQKRSIVKIIAEITILDPTCGSGAFPMGALHRLSLALKRLDPDNKIWREVQGIADTKDNRTLEYERKLYLIRNNLFGVDIQVVACQLAKLRFFISLAIEQNLNDDSPDNYDIKPLPNLETRFIAGDTLIRFGRTRQEELIDKRVANHVSKLMEIRKQHVNIILPKDKQRYQLDDKRERSQLVNLIRNERLLISDYANKIEEWDPYELDSKANWFDHYWMFGVKDGFDVVLGNPPYIELKKNEGELGIKYQPYEYDCFNRKGDIYMLFYERGIDLCKENGFLMFITSNIWLRSKYGSGVREVLLYNCPYLLIDMGDGVFENAVVSTNILLTQKTSNTNRFKAGKLLKKDFQSIKYYNINPDPKDAWIIRPKTEMQLSQKIQNTGTKLIDWSVRINLGIITGRDPSFIIDQYTKEKLCSEDVKSENVIHPTIRGKNIEKYLLHSSEHMIVIPQGWTNESRGRSDPEEFFRTQFPAIYQHLIDTSKLKSKASLYTRTAMGDYWWELRSCSFYSDLEQEKLIWTDISSSGKFVYVPDKLYPLQSTFSMVGESLLYLLAILNSSLVNWYMQGIAVNLGEKSLRWRKVYVEKIPVPRISNEDQQPLAELARKITEAKRANPDEDTSAWEDEIDKRVYQLYGLSQEEVLIIKDSKKR